MNAGGGRELAARRDGAAHRLRDLYIGQRRRTFCARRTLGVAARRMKGPVCLSPPAIRRSQPSRFRPGGRSAHPRARAFRSRPWRGRKPLSRGRCSDICRSTISRRRPAAALRDNRRAFDEYGFVPRVLNDVSGREQTATLFGKAYAAPFGIPPFGSAALCAYRGDVVLARAAAAMNVPMILSAASLISLEDVRRANPNAWYQAYLAGDASRIEPLVDRVAAAGYDTFVVTADVPVSANRENNIRNGFQVPLVVTPQVAFDVARHPRWLLGTWMRTLVNHGMPHFENMDATRGPPVLSQNLMRNLGSRDQLAWKHVELIRRRWNGKLVVKGIHHAVGAAFAGDASILRREDARIARECGADGVM